MSGKSKPRDAADYAGGIDLMRIAGGKANAQSQIKQTARRQHDDRNNNAAPAVVFKQQ